MVDIPSGNLLHSCGKSPFFMGKVTISMAMSNSYVKLPEGNLHMKYPEKCDKYHPTSHL